DSAISDRCACTRHGGGHQQSTESREERQQQDWCQRLLLEELGTLDNSERLLTEGSRMIYSSGRWHIDTARFELVRDNRPAAVQPKVLDLLILLIENCERIVSKDEILDTIWKGRVVSEAALSGCIKAARQAI